MLNQWSNYQLQILVSYIHSKNLSTAFGRRLLQDRDVYSMLNN